MINRYKEHKSVSEKEFSVGPLDIFGKSPRAALQLLIQTSVQNIKWRKPHKPPVKPWDTNKRLGEWEIEWLQSIRFLDVHHGYQQKLEKNHHIT